MKFFYVVGDHDAPIVFNTQDGQQLFSVQAIKDPSSGIPSTHLYMGTENQLMMIANAIRAQFGDAINVMAFSEESAKEKGFIKAKVIGSGAIFGSEEEKTTSLSEAIDEWKDAGKDGVAVAHIGSFGGDFKRAIVSSSVFNVAIGQITEAGLTLGVDLHISNIEPGAGVIANHLLPLNSILTLPVSIEFLNGYDCVFVSESETLESMGIGEAENLQDFYASIYGVKRYQYPNVFIVNEAAIETMKDTLAELSSEAERKVLVDLDGLDESSAKKLVLSVSKETQTETIFSLNAKQVKLDLSKEGVKLISLDSLLDSKLENLGATIANLDLFVGKNTFMIDICHAYQTPSVTMFYGESNGRMLQYYNVNESMINSSLFLSEERKDLESEFSRIISAVKGLWLLRDEAKSRSESNAPSDNNSDEPNEVVEEKPSRLKKISIIIATSTLVAAGAYAAHLAGMI